jgi:hypothetical protein
VLRLKGRSWIALASAAALVALYRALVSMGAVPLAKVCSKPEGSNKDVCTYHDVVSAVVGRMIVFFDAHNGTVAALAAIAVAVFTYALWASTEKLWQEAQSQRREAKRSAFASITAARAAKKSADAITILERAYVYPSEIADNLGSAINTRVYNLDDERAVFNINIVIELSFKNFGKTPAHLESGFVVLHFLDILEEEQKVYSADIVFNYALGAGEQIDPVRINFCPEFTALANRQIRDGAAKVVLNGHVSYRDVWDKSHISVVRFVYDPKSGRLMPGKTQGNT